MESSKKKATLWSKKRALRVRSHLRGTQVKPRLCVVKTNKHIHVQLIDDSKHATVAAVSTHSKESPLKKSKESARTLGERLAEKALALGISSAVFDRGPFKFHGLLKEFADAARAKGLQL